jgi:hypothetical protein
VAGLSYSLAVGAVDSMATDQLIVDDTSWLAVKDASVDAVVHLLSLSPQRPADWRRGLEAAAGDYEEFFESRSEWEELACVFVTPMVRGWRLVVGDYLGAGPATRSRGDNRNGWRTVAGWCRRLSREFGQAHAFTDQAQLDWYSWILARDGTVFRQAVFADGGFLSDRGDPTGIEARLRARFVPDEIRRKWQPDVGDVPAIAGEWSVNPWKLGSVCKKNSLGVVAVTPWGRSHGVRNK